VCDRRGFTFSSRMHLDEFAFVCLARIENEHAALTQVARRVVRKCDQRKSEHVSTKGECFLLIRTGGEQAKGSEAKSRIAADTTSGNDTAM